VCGQGEGEGGGERERVQKIERRREGGRKGGTQKEGRERKRDE